MKRGDFAAQNIVRYGNLYLPKPEGLPPRIPTSVLIKLGEEHPPIFDETTTEVLATTKFRKLGASTIRAHDLERFIDFVRSKKLHFEIIATVGTTNGYSHIHIPPHKDKPISFFIAYSKRRKYLTAFKNAYKNHDHFAQGDLLGYPKCCQQFFVDMSKIGYFDTTIPQLMLGDSTLLTQSLRYGGWRVVPFLPCSPRCKAALEIAKRYLQFIEPWWSGRNYSIETQNGLITIDVHPVKIYSGTVRIRQHMRFTGVYGD